MSQEQDLFRARQAAALLQEPVMKEAFQKIEQHYVTCWKNSKPTEYELREECHNGMYALGQFQLQLRHFIETGTLIMANVSENSENVIGDQKLV